MKNRLSISIFVFINLILFLNSCSTSEFAINKRLYNKGFYVDFKKNSSIKIENNFQKTELAKNNQLKPDTNYLIASTNFEYQFVPKIDTPIVTAEDFPSKLKIDTTKIDSNITHSYKESLTTFKEFVPTEKQTQKYVTLSIIIGILSIILIPYGVFIFNDWIFLIGLALEYLSLHFHYLAKIFYQRNPEYTHRKKLYKLGFIIGASYLILSAAFTYLLYIIWGVVIITSI